MDIQMPTGQFNYNHTDDGQSLSQRLDGLDMDLQECKELSLDSSSLNKGDFGIDSADSYLEPDIFGILNQDDYDLDFFGNGHDTGQEDRADLSQYQPLPKRPRISDYIQKRGVEFSPKHYSCAQEHQSPSAIGYNHQKLPIRYDSPENTRFYCYEGTAQPVGFPTNPFPVQQTPVQMNLSGQMGYQELSTMHSPLSDTSSMEHTCHVDLRMGRTMFPFSWIKPNRYFGYGPTLVDINSEMKQKLQKMKPVHSKVGRVVITTLEPSRLREVTSSTMMHKH